MLSYLCFARWFSIVSLCLSLGILFNLDDARAKAKELIRDESGYIMGGVLPIIFGSLTFTCYHRFDLGWQTVVTLVGIAMTGIGIYRVMFPRHWKSYLTRHIDKLPPLFALFGLMFGLLLMYVGYIYPLIHYQYTG